MVQDRGPFQTGTRPENRLSAAARGSEYPRAPRPHVYKHCELCAPGAGDASIGVGEVRPGEWCSPAQSAPPDRLKGVAVIGAFAQSTGGAGGPRAHRTGIVRSDTIASTPEVGTALLYAVWSNRLKPLSDGRDSKFLGIPGEVGRAVSDANGRSPRWSSVPPLTSGSGLGH